MRYHLENEILRVEVDTFGAELKSVQNKKTGQEYLWHADPAYWGRTAPVLFPFVGSLRDKKYTFEGTEYPMTSHGFARDMVFSFKQQSEDALWFALKDSAATYENYPFHFELQIGYILSGNTLSVLWKVINPGQDRADQNLYFSIGAHPAFLCPLKGEADKSDYRLYFGEVDCLKHHGNLTGTCTHEDLTLELTDHRAVLTPEFFDRTTYIIEGKQTGLVAIETPEGHPYVRVRFDTPLFAVWSPEKKNAPFLCIEPWCGRADYEDYEGDLTAREYGNVLAPAEVFENVYSIDFD